MCELSNYQLKDVIMNKLLWIIPLFVVGCAFGQSPCSVSAAYPGSYICNVDGSTGVSANHYVKWNTAGTGVVIGATTDTQGVVGVANATQIGGGGLLVTRYGPALVAFDGATTAGHTCGISSGTNGDFTDTGAAGATAPSAIVQCTILQTIGSAGNAWVDLVPYPQKWNPMTTQGDVICGGATGSLTRNALPFIAQTDGATITFALSNACFMNGSVTLGGNRTLNITNPQNGGTYLLKVTQDGTGGRTLTPGTGCTWKVANGGAGAFSLSSAANAIDVITWIYDGTNCLTTIQKNWN